MRQILLLSIFIILVVAVQGQKKTKTDTTFLPADGKSYKGMDKLISTGTFIPGRKKYKKVYIYVWGLRGRFDDDPSDSCRVLLHNTYGIGYKTKAGCVVRVGQVKRWQRHNKKVDKKLNSRLGGDWRVAFNTEVVKCVGK